MSEKKASIIEEARQARGYTQEQVANVIGVSRPTYKDIESGKKDLTLRQAEALSSLLRISRDEILGIVDIASAFADVIKSMEKYKQIILNCLKFGASSDGKITKTKLAKLVYLADFIWYYQNFLPMSGMIYRKQARGPVAYEFFGALDELEEEGTIVREEIGKAYLFSLIENEAPASRLLPAEIDLIKKISEGWKGKSTNDLVSFTREQLPWQICREGEVIPYSLITQEEPERVYGPIEL